MTTADPSRAAPRWGARAGQAPDGARARTEADHHAARTALAAARLDAPGGRAQLEELLGGAAERYAVVVLGLHGDTAVPELVAAAVARAVRTLPRDLAPDELVDHLHLAVRHEAWRRQRGRSTHSAVTRAVAAAALVLVAVALGVVVLTVTRSMDDPEPAADTIASVLDEDGVVRGRVVDTSASGTVLGGRGEVVVALIVDGTAVRATETDDAGRFALTGLAAGSYELRVEVPVGLRLRGRDGRSTTVDLTDRTEASVVLQLERS